jgi:hypothetical protein
VRLLRIWNGIQASEADAARITELSHRSLSPAR